MSQHHDAPPPRARPRDAARTREQLLGADVRRFSTDGCAGTTVRHVADDAGVAVALIERFFGSEEGLFGARPAAAVDALRRGVLHQQSGRLAPALRADDRGTGSGAPEEDAPVGPDRGDLVPSQVLLAAAVGIAVLRSFPGLQPLSSASADELAGVLGGLRDRAVTPRAARGRA